MTTHRIIKNLFLMTSAQMIGAILHMASFIYLARTLGPENFGKLNFSEAILVYFLILSNLGLDMLGTRHLAREKDGAARKSLVERIVTLKVFLGLFAFIFFLAFIWLVNKPEQIKMLLLFYGFSIFPSAFFMDWAFQGVEKMSYNAVAVILREAVFLGAVVVMIDGPHMLAVVPVIFIFARIAPAMYFMWAFKRHFGRFSLKFDFASWIGLAKESLILGYSILVIPIFYNLDIIMLGFMKTDKEVGYYNAAYKPILFFVILVSTYYTVIFPRAVYCYREAKDELERLLSYSVKLMFFFILPVSIGGTMLAKPLINMFYGQAYNDGVTAFQILLWSLFVISIGTIYGRGLVACDREKLFAVGLTVGAVSNLAFNLALIPPYGPTGAAAATVMSEIINLYIYHWGLRKVIKVSFGKEILKSLVASFVMAVFIGVGLVVGWNVISIIIGAGLLYIAVLYAIKGITMDEIRMVREGILRG
ncbi:MAG: flippase [Thermodesulfobacteriota bacterium]